MVVLRSHGVGSHLSYEAEVVVWAWKEAEWATVLTSLDSTAAKDVQRLAMVHKDMVWRR